MSEPFKIDGRVYQVGGSEISGHGDCSVYLIDAGSELILVDSGIGKNFGRLVENIETLDFDVEKTGVYYRHS